MSKVLQVVVPTEREEAKAVVAVAAAGKDENNFGHFSKPFLERHGLYLVGTTST